MCNVTGTQPALSRSPAGEVVAIVIVLGLIVLGNTLLIRAVSKRRQRRHSGHLLVKALAVAGLANGAWNTFLYLITKVAGETDIFNVKTAFCVTINHYTKSIVLSCKCGDVLQVT